MPKMLTSLVWRVSTVVLLLVVPMGSAAFAGDCARATVPVLSLGAASGPVQVTGAAAIFRDLTGEAEYEAVVAAYRQGRFTQHCGADVAPSDLAGALWMRFDVSRPADGLKNWILTFGQSQIDEA